MKLCQSKEDGAVRGFRLALRCCWVSGLLDFALHHWVFCLMKIHAGVIRCSGTPVTQRPLTLRNIHEDRNPQYSAISYSPTVWPCLWVRSRKFQSGATWYVFRLTVSGRDAPFSDSLVADYFQIFLHPLCRFHCRWRVECYAMLTSGGRVFGPSLQWQWVSRLAGHNTHAHVKGRFQDRSIRKQ